VPGSRIFRPAIWPRAAKARRWCRCSTLCDLRSPIKVASSDIGGIANLTAIRAGGSPDDLVAFDTGPGNMVIEPSHANALKKDYDRGGAVARKDWSSARCLNNP